jgi:SAM-dependent methyltransferase
MDERFHAFERTVEDWHWWYRGRRAILDSVMAPLGLDPARALLLDIGCGTGGSAQVLSRYGRVVALDRKQQSFALSMERPYAHRVVGTAESLPFGDASFDAVAALDILEHLDDDVGGAREIRRVLKPGGAAVVFVPALSILWGQNDDFSHHRRRYTGARLRRVLESGGLRVGPVGYFNLLLFLPTLLARLAERVVPRAVGRFEYRERPSLVNELLAGTFRLELPLLRRRPLPIGTSAFCVARRPAEARAAARPPGALRTLGAVSGA